MIEPSQVKLAANLMVTQQMIARLFASQYFEKGLKLSDFDAVIRPSYLGQASVQSFEGMTPEFGDLLAAEFEDALSDQLALQRSLLERLLTQGG
ncbi:hypothetical protein [Phenylobacterium sp.]|uniref:hypothetical protein n=1 Tax=Phenylobacterium sp. TaxID=1871053 RepID=UPI00271D3EB5|nr:hypothetical protein [Phenylobacterium sp.]MDO8380352.1 hypothetical protein [Phenylobacterium sp.]